MPIRKSDINGVAPGSLRRVGPALIGAVLWLVAATSAAAAGDAQALLREHKCYACHADDAWKAGPSFRDVAASYRASHKPASKMISLIRQGQHGAGPWHMPPSQVSRDEAKAMAEYILSLR